MDDLPNYFDVIVIGTGMPECIVAAAASRVGKTVLHLERKAYYGGDWASFSFDKFLEWIDEVKAISENSEESSIVEDTLVPFLNENERLALCRLKSHTISNLVVKSYISETPAPSIQTYEAPLPADNSSQEVSAENATSESDVNENSEASSSEVGDQLTNERSVSLNPHPDPSLQHEWTISQFIENRRKFNIDLTPKLLFSRGSLVELLISSNIARYAEFQCVNRVLTYINGHLEQVPSSRADVFSTKNVTVVEKRMLMKFLTSCLNFDEHKEEYEGYEEVPFFQYLRSKKLTPNVEHYIIHAIAMVDESCNTLEGLKSTQKFLQSLGRYGNSPFLCTCYGSAELPQCFCRLCAVYGGMYYLKRDVEALVLNNDRTCGILSMNQRIGCQWLVMESSYCPAEFLPSNISDRISKGIFITDASLYPSDKKENTLLMFPSGPNNCVVTVLEFSSKTCVCPEDLFIVYMYCRSSKSTAEEDLMPVFKLLFQEQNISETSENSSVEGDVTTKKPNVLWCVFFNQLDTSTVDLNTQVPAGLYVTSSPDTELDYEHAVKEAQYIFARLCPGEEFLPRAPDPEDILVESHNSAGDDCDKIENDVTQSENEFAQTTDDSTNSENEQEATSCDNSAESIEK